jgi:hypothetical protein
MEPNECWRVLSSVFIAVRQVMNGADTSYIRASASQKKPSTLFGQML